MEELFRGYSKSCENCKNCKTHNENLSTVARCSLTGRKGRIIISERNVTIKNNKLIYNDADTLKHRLELKRPPSWCPEKRTYQ